MTQLGSTSGPTYSECIAVSATNDPRGSYNLYKYDFGGSLNDYPKFGVWPTATNSAYLASYNMFANGQTFTGAQLCAYDRMAMINHASSPAAICFTVPNDGNFLPADLDGPTPPAAGTPGLFLNFETTGSLRLYQLSATFGTPPTPPTGTLSAPTDIAVAAFAPACNGGACIVQPNSQKLDSLGDRLMYRLAYRMFSDHASMVVNHSVTAGSSVGVRWYEFASAHRHARQLQCCPARDVRARCRLSLDGQRGDGWRGEYRDRLQQIEQQRLSLDRYRQPDAGDAARHDGDGKHLAGRRRRADDLQPMGRLHIASYRSGRRHDVLVHQRVLQQEQPVL